MHEKGLFMTKYGTILGKTNMDIRIKNMAYIVSKSQNLLLKVGDVKSEELSDYAKTYKNAYKERWSEAVAEDIEILILKENQILTLDDICSLTNYLMLNPCPVVVEMLQAPELKLKTFIQKLQFKGY